MRTQQSKRFNFIESVIATNTLENEIPSAARDRELPSALYEYSTAVAGEKNQKALIVSPVNQRRGKTQTITRMFAFPIKLVCSSIAQKFVFVPADVRQTGSENNPSVFRKCEANANFYFHFRSLQRPDENLDVSLSVPQYNGHPPPSHIRYHNLNDQVREIEGERQTNDVNLSSSSLCAIKVELSVD